MRGCLVLLCGFILCVPFVGWAVTRTYDSIIFDREIGGRLKRAADANSIELAKQELEAVVKKAEDWKITDGYTSVLYTVPSEDVGFWYKNIKTCLVQINGLSTTATQGEKDLVLMKLRQTLLDHKGGHETVTVPEGISVFPNNIAFCVWGWISALVCLVGLVVMAAAVKDNF